VLPLPLPAAARAADSQPSVVEPLVKTDDLRNVNGTVAAPQPSADKQENPQALPETTSTKNVTPEEHS
jgi:hypothetical protein